jgi:UDP-3-O-[3-hydroxymyristoyl] glucosamine N-acyltransferase
MITTVQELAEMIKGRVEGDPTIKIFAPSVIEEATDGTITFLSSTRYENYMYSTKASAVIVDEYYEPNIAIRPTLIRVENVTLALSKVLDFFNSISAELSGISETSIVDASSKIDENVYLGHYSTIGKNCCIGKRSIIYNHVVVGDNVTIGEECIIYPGVVIYANTLIGNHCILHANSVIGSDGFGFVPMPDGTFKKIPHLGNVIIEDDVEVGANTVIDRASLGSTIIKKGVKLDNLIQIAHNVQLGENTAIAAQTGIAGSTKVGSNCLIGGQVGIAGHISVADRTLIQAKSGISSNISEKGKKMYGYPAIDYQNYLKSYAYFKNFEQLVDKLRKLEKDIDLLKQENEVRRF